MIVPRKRRMAQEHAPEVQKVNENEEEAVIASPFYHLFLTNMISSFSTAGTITEYLVGNMRAQEVKALDKATMRFVQEDGEFPSLLAESIDMVTDPDIRVGESFLTCLREEAKESVYPRFSEIVDLLINSYLSQEESSDLLQSLADHAFPRFTPSAREQPRLKHITKIFGLNEKEVDLVMYYYCTNHDHNFEELCYFRRSIKEFPSIAAVVGVKLGELYSLLSGKGNLRRQSIIVARAGWKRQSEPEIDAGIDDYLTGLSSRPFRTRVERLPASRFELDSFGLKEGSLQVMKDIIESKESKHILIYGTPGAGKTEFVKALIGSSSRIAYSLKMGDADQTRSARLVALSAAVRATEADAGILVVDECDNLLCTEGRSIFKGTSSMQGKEWLNLFLDSIRIPTIWITNSIEGIHPSVKRRFAFAEHFATLSIENRLSMWATLCRNHGIAEFGHYTCAIELVRRFLPSPAEMASVLSVIPGVSPNQRVTRMETVLEAKAMLISGHNEPKRSPTTITDSYKEDALNCDAPLAMVIRSVQTAVSREKPLALLFHGAPGTGKTELVKHIARLCDRELYVRRASDILSPYVGVAEQNIAKVFRAAEQSHRILLLDEADSFFQNRMRARNSWEVSQVNELLTQMESFQGVLFACTNLIDSLDSATLRRFSWKVKFSPPNLRQRQLLFATWFPSLPLDETAIGMLKEAEGVCPGDFKAVHARLWIQQDNPTEEFKLKAEDIIAELIRETSYRVTAGCSKNPIGFKAG